jgi:hypothetical protein
MCHKAIDTIIAQSLFFFSITRRIYRLRDKPMGWTYPTYEVLIDLLVYYLSTY